MLLVLALEELSCNICKVLSSSASVNFRSLRLIRHEFWLLFVFISLADHLIIIGKHFLYINAVQDEKRPQFTDFVTLVNEKIELEKYIAITTNKLLSFTKKWSNFLNN